MRLTGTGLEEGERRQSRNQSDRRRADKEISKGGITEAKGVCSGVEDNCKGIRSGGEDGDSGRQQQTGERTSPLRSK